MTPVSLVNRVLAAETDRQGRSLHPQVSMSTPPSKEFDIPTTYTVLIEESFDGSSKKWRSELLNAARDVVVSLTQNASLIVVLYEGNIPSHFSAVMKVVPSTHDTYTDPPYSAYVQLQLTNVVVVAPSDGREEAVLTYTAPPFPLDAVHDVNVV